MKRSERARLARRNEHREVREIMGTEFRKNLKRQARIDRVTKLISDLYDGMTNEQLRESMDLMLHETPQLALVVIDNEMQPLLEGGFGACGGCRTRLESLVASSAFSPKRSSEPSKSSKSSSGNVHLL